METDLVITKIFNRVVRDYSDRTALQIKGESGWSRFTYQQIMDRALEVGAFLIERGYKKGEYIGLMLENRPEWPMIYLGIMYAGLTCVPLDIQLSQPELENIIKDCQAGAIFTSCSLFTAKFDHLTSILGTVVVLDSNRQRQGAIDFAEIGRNIREGVDWPEVYPQDPASLIYTSGTTANPKGVILSQGNLCANFISVNKLNLCFSDDNILSILPLHHSYAFMVTLLVPLFIGARVTYCASFKPEDLSGIMNEGEVTVLVGVPQLFSLLHKAIFSRIKKTPYIFRILLTPIINKKVHNNLGKKLRLFVSGGARLNPQIAKDLHRIGFKIIEGYGLTETSPVVTLNPPEGIKFGSVGKPIPGVDIQIFNPDSSGVGEVFIRGANIMQGYYKQPDLTSQVLDNGWFHSGDLGYLDKQGYLFLTGRKKDVIVLSSGKNIYPEELEEFFLSSSPYIKEICILGLTQNKFGKDTEAIYAVVVPNLEYFRKNNEINIREKIRWEIDNLSKKLPSYQHIMGFVIAKDGLPRTHLKKIKRYQVKEQYFKENILSDEENVAPLSETDIRVLQSETAKKIIDFLSKELKKRVTLDSHLEIDLGIDSLSRVELGLGLEMCLNRKIPDKFIENVFTVKELITGLNDVFENEKEIELPEFKKEKKSWQQIVKEYPSSEILAKIRLTSSFLDRFIALISKAVIGFIFRLFCFLRVEGRESIPKEGAYIIVANHASYLDGFLIFTSIPFGSVINLFFLGQAAIFKHPIIAWAVKLARLIAIDPSIHLTQAMQAAGFVLRHKKAICIFPEGSRSIDEQVQVFKKGVGILAKELDVLIIPAYIQGSHYTWPRTSKFPRPHPVRIIFGKPLNWNQLGNDYETIANRLREEVIKLKA